MGVKKLGFMFICLAVLAGGESTLVSTSYADQANKTIKSTAKYVQASKTQPISIVFGGDTQFSGSTLTAVKNHGAAYPFSYVKKDLQSADYAVLNLETSITNLPDSYRDRSQRYNFKAPASVLSGIKQSGVDLISIANNHALDYGQQGLLDTMKSINNAGLSYMGAGKTMKEAFSARTVIIKGKRIKFIAATRFAPSSSQFTFKSSTKAGVAGAYQLDPLIKAIQNEKKNADYIVLYLHWGVEKSSKPAAYEWDYLKRIVKETDVDAIIGSHPHVLQGFTYYPKKSKTGSVKYVPVAFSLGNFLFPDYVKGKTAQTGLLKLTLDGKQPSISFKPFQISKDVIRPVSSHYKKEMDRYLQSISYNVTIKDGKIIRK